MYKFKCYLKDGLIIEQEALELDIEDYSFNDIAKIKFDSLLDDNNAEKINNCYKIEIIDNNTDEILGYYDDSECLVDGNKGHLEYDARSGDIISAVADNEKENENEKIYYGFKFYYEDGTTSCGGKKALTPEGLYVDFDGLMEWEEYDELKNRNLSTHELLEMAVKLYTFMKKKYNKIEIINCSTNDVIDYIEIQRGGK